MNAKDVDLFEKVRGQLKELHNEIAILSKAKPDNPVNKFKLKFINEKLGDANAVLADSFKPLKGFTLFADDSLPSNSDVVMILSQYLDALESWRCAHIHRLDYKGWVWNVDDRDIDTSNPTRFIEGQEGSEDD